MRWIEACIPTQSEQIDELCLRLTDLGIEGVSIEDEADYKNFLENNHEYWDYVDDGLNARFAGLSQVKFYVEDSDDGKAQIKRIRETLQVTVNTTRIADSDWENNWREYYKPLKIGEKLLVVPEWEDVQPEGRAVLRLDPGLLFGTGTHATTRMCLLALQEQELKGKSVLDLGCGSGILGIGARVLGCESVTGCDIDPKAPDVALSNAMLNGITADGFQIFAGNILTDAGMKKRIGGGYDIVLANIVADVIISLSSVAAGFMAEDAVFICSGIIEGRQDEVCAALQKNGLEAVEHKNEEEWHCYVCKKVK